MHGCLCVMILALNPFTPTLEQRGCHYEQTKARQRHGLEAQTLDQDLCNKAQEWAEVMATKDRMYHSPWDVSENVLHGSKTADAAIRVWMGSRKHKANLLSHHSLVGFGHAVSRSGVHYWCSIHSDSKEIR